MPMKHAEQIARAENRLDCLLSGMSVTPHEQVVGA